MALTLILAACQDDGPAAPTAVGHVSNVTPSPSSIPHPLSLIPSSPAPSPQPTAVPPTPTPTEPLAALVNGQPLYLAAYEQELARTEQAQAELGITPGADDTDYRQLVLDALIEQRLIAQEAAARGLAVTPEMVEARLAELRSVSGDVGTFSAWLQANRWTEEEFKIALAAEMVTELIVAQVTADVPYAAEHVHARYLQVEDAALAQSLLDQIRAGADFAALARQHSLDRMTGENGGDLGFFSAGALLVPEVEAAAFALQPGETSELIAVATADGSQTTYYLVQLIERDPARPLDGATRSQLLQETFEAWLAELWGKAEVERLIEP